MRLLLGIISALLFWAMYMLPASAQSVVPDSSPTTNEPAYESGASRFGGPTSVGGTFDSDRRSDAMIPAVDQPTRGYFDFKQQVEEKYGLAFGFDYNTLYQKASQSPGEDSAAGGALRVFGQWTLTGRGTENTGTLVFKLENRHRLGTDIPPQNLGFEIGYAGLTAVPFSDIGWALTNFYWDQHTMDKRVAFVAGVVDVTDYVNVYGLVNPWADFSNLAFSTDPTIPAPDQGLGVAIRVMATENLYAIVGLADANGHPTEPEEMFDSFFDDSEYFTHLEIGWISSWTRRFEDNIHFTLWHADEREAAEVPDGWGTTFSFSHILGDKWEPFFRAGYAEDGGALWEGSVSAGIGYHVRGSDMLSIGVNWSKPYDSTPGSELDDQYTAEVYYRLQLAKVMAVTPNVQLLVNPALNPDEDMIAVFGLRARFSF